MIRRIVAARSDGLCMRLLALPNAIELVEGGAGQFGIYWPVFDHPEVDLQPYTNPARIFAGDWLASQRRLLTAGLAVSGPIRDALAAGRSDLA